MVRWAQVHSQQALEIRDFCNDFNQLCSPGSVRDLINLPVRRLYRPSATAGGRKVGKMETKSEGKLLGPGVLTARERH